MKTVAALLILSLSALLARAEVFDSATSKTKSLHGVTVSTVASGGLAVWTNTCRQPVRLESVVIDAPAIETNAVTLTLLRWHDIAYQKKPSDVTTNEFNMVVTNTYNQVTNIVASLHSNTVASATITGDGSLNVNHATAANRIPWGLYSLPGDVWQVTVGTNDAGVILNFGE